MHEGLLGLSPIIVYKTSWPAGNCKVLFTNLDMQSCDLKLSDFNIFSFEKKQKTKTKTKTKNKTKNKTKPNKQTKKHFENTIYTFENQQFSVLRRCFYELFQ